MIVRRLDAWSGRFPSWRQAHRRALEALDALEFGHMSKAQSRAMRKLYWSLVLPLLMLLAQQGSVWHDISHLRQTSRSDPSRQQPADKVCESCVSFAQVATATTAEVPAVHLAIAAFGFTLPADVATAVSETPALRNRGPPTLL